MSGTRRLAAQVAGSAGVQVWLAFLGIFTTPFILRGLGTGGRARGLLNLARRG